MTGLSIPEEEAHIFAEGVRRGGVLVAVQVEDPRVEAARALLRDAGAADTQRLRSEWQQAGWTRFEPQPGDDSDKG
jgi:predicted O-methyltransferase YrrM